MDNAKENYRIQKWICGLAVVLFLLKILAWYVTHSVAILADALESIVNVVAGFIGLYSLYVAAKPKDVDHPYGHGKAEFVSAAMEGLMILAAGCLIIYHAIIHFGEQNAVESLDKGLILVLATALLNYFLGYRWVKQGEKNHSLAITASGNHLKIDAYSTFAVIIGLIFILIFHLYWLDKVIALVMGCFILVNGYSILRKSIAGIMDEADLNLINELVAVLSSNRQPDWIDIHNLKVVKYGSKLHIDCHFTVPYYLTVQEAHDEITRLQKLVAAHFSESIEFNIHTDPCRDCSCAICTKTECPVRKHPFVRQLEWNLKAMVDSKQHRIN
ncbi:cation diffusion facilitator family transporter [Rhizosphaericola mali]|uniref:Cation transporter n=1 Tax=Rhizosphaericola mali TaxID=2545455 RepID=A0A5P2G811_9BACT|nr:cation diffusion facilitator family transporter [Rhizosphaericola mali]QES87661.1 cation transporter [Rhizosphaericola mali]